MSSEIDSALIHKIIFNGKMFEVRDLNERALLDAKNSFQDSVNAIKTHFATLEDIGDNIPAVKQLALKLAVSCLKLASKHETFELRRSNLESTRLGLPIVNEKWVKDKLKVRPLATVDTLGHD